MKKFGKIMSMKIWLVIIVLANIILGGIKTIGWENIFSSEGGINEIQK